MGLQSRASSGRHKRSPSGPRPSRFFLLTACLLLVGLTLALCARRTIGWDASHPVSIDDDARLPGELPGQHTPRLTRLLTDEGSGGEAEGSTGEAGLERIHGMFGLERPGLVLGKELPVAASLQSEAGAGRTAINTAAGTVQPLATLPEVTQTASLPEITQPKTLTETTQAITLPGDDLEDDLAAVEMSSSLGGTESLDQPSSVSVSRAGDMGAREIDVRGALQSISSDEPLGEVITVVEDPEYGPTDIDDIALVRPGSVAVATALGDEDAAASGDPRLAGVTSQAESNLAATSVEIPREVPTAHESKTDMLPGQQKLVQGSSAMDPSTGKTAVLFMTGGTKEDLDSLRFFVRNALGDETSTFLLAVADPTSTDLPALPPQARYVQLPAAPCLWGAMGKLLDGAGRQLLTADYAIIIGSDLRGPFLPSYFQGNWMHAFTGRLTPVVKLVGPIMSCFPVAGTEALHAELGAPTSSLPFLHPSMFATDTEGLELLKENSVFECPGAGSDSIRYPSAKASSVILGAGKSLDTLLLRYKGINWRDRQYWDCNGQAEPTFMHSYDGEHLNPLEVMFAPVDRQRLYSSHPTARLAKRYDTWQQELGKADTQVSTNLYTNDPTTYRAKRMAYMQSRGPGCFDKAFYQSHSPDLQGMGAADLWEHFWKNGQFEGREYRFSCVDLKARGAGCFDNWFYITQNIDLNDLRLAGNPFTPEQSWHHFVTDGQFSGRHYKFNAMCGEDIDSPNSIDYSSSRR